jgi:hypothetical protein
MSRRGTERRPSPRAEAIESTRQLPETPPRKIVIVRTIAQIAGRGYLVLARGSARRHDAGQPGLSPEQMQQTLAAYNVRPDAADRQRRQLQLPHGRPAKSDDRRSHT